MSQKIGASLAAIGVDQETCRRIQNEGDQLHKALCTFGQMVGGEKAKPEGLLLEQVSSMVQSYDGSTLNEDQKACLCDTI